MINKLLGGFVFCTMIILTLQVSANSGLVYAASTSGLKLDLDKPDVLVRSKSLSKLPADLLKVPLLHALLSEDFLFYYEHSEGRLGLKGTIRRIAYEHDVTFTDELIKMVLAEPADVALWRGSKGELKHYIISISRNSLAKLFETVAKIAMDDKQLSVTGEFKLEGQAVKLYALEYGAGRRLLFTSYKDRMVVISEPAMLLNAEGAVSAKAEILLADLLGADKQKQRRFDRVFNLDSQTRKHSIAVSTNFLFFNYQAFFPSLKAVRFDFGDQPSAGNQTWSTAMLMQGESQQPAAMTEKTLWQSLPHQAGACLSLPVDWRAVTGTMSSQKVAGMTTEQLTSMFGGPAALCWYAQSRLHSPLFIAQLSKTETADKMLEDYFNYGIQQAGANEKKVRIKAQKVNAGDVVWRAEMNEDHMQPSLARSGKLVYFSPDGILVDRALEVVHKRQPALSDRWKWDVATANTVAMFSPEPMAQLAELEIAKSLPRHQDELLRGAADRHLLPKLAAVKKYPPMRLEMRSPPKGTGWIELDWQPF